MTVNENKAPTFANEWQTDDSGCIFALAFADMKDWHLPISII